MDGGVKAGGLRMNGAQYLHEPMCGGEPHGAHEELRVFRDIDCAAVATSFGAIGRRVTRPRDSAPAVKEALEAGRLTVIDAVTGVRPSAPGRVTGVMELGR